MAIDSSGATTATFAAGVGLPVGMITPFAGSTAPTGWFLCGGQAVSRTTYASLFAVVGTTYGAGDGSTTFNLPDLRGRAVAGVDNMGGTDAGRLDIANSSGTVVGSQYVTLTGAQSGVPAHAHANTLTNNAVTSGAGSAHQHANTLTNALTATHNHRHEFGFSLLDNYYSATGSAAAMGSAGMGGAYRYSTGAWQGAVSNGTVTDTRRDATSVSAGSSARMSTFGDTETPTGSNTVGISNVNESAHTHSVTSNVSISNVNNTAANAAESHSVMQPTMVLNYIVRY
jgi:microcystin-dependent protein